MATSGCHCSKLKAYENVKKKPHDVNNSYVDSSSFQ